jgi:hypothetical protein
VSLRQRRDDVGTGAAQEKLKLPVRVGGDGAAVPGMGFPEAERCASEKRACTNRRRGLQPGVPSRTGPGQPNEISVLPVRRPLEVTAGLATPTGTPMHTTAALPIVTSLRKSWPPHTSCPRKLTSHPTQTPARRERLRLPSATGGGLAPPGPSRPCTAAAAIMSATAGSSHQSPKEHVALSLRRWRRWSA